MPVLFDKSGNRYEFQTVEVHGDSTVCFDGYRFVQGVIGDFTPEVLPITQVTRIGFKALFTGTERLAIKKARTTDDLLEDFFSMAEDSDSPGVDLTLQSTLDALLLLESLEIITEERRLQILAGVPQ